MGQISNITSTHFKENAYTKSIYAYFLWVMYMRYDNLHELIFSSSSSRQYFLSLPVEIQIILHEQNDFIHTLFELRRNAEYVMKKRG